MPTEVQFVIQDDHEIRFARHGASKAVWDIGVAIFCWGYLGYCGRDCLLILEGWLLGAFGLLFAVAGLSSALWRYALTLDFRSRTWVRRQGHWPRVRTRAGTFSDLEGLILAIEIHSTRRVNQYPHWMIRLAIKGESDPVAIADFLDEQKAYEHFTSLVKTLQLVGIDRTGDREARLDWKAVDRPLVSQAAHVDRRVGQAATLPLLPPGSAIRVSGLPPNRSIILPAEGWSLGAIVVILVGAFFVVFGMMLWRNSVALPENPSPVIYILVPTISSLLGTYLVWLMLSHCISHEEIQDRGDRFVFGRRILGRLTRTKSVDKRSVDEVAVKPAVSFGEASILIRGWSAGPQQPTFITHHVFVRSRQGLLRVGGYLAPEEQAWLRDSLVSWLTT